MVRRGAAGAALAVVLLAGCSSDAGPSSGLEEHLRDVAAAHDDHYADHGEYPDPFRLSDVADMTEEDERWNLVAYYGRNFGYCLEGDDEDGGTWHLTRDADELVEGECPRSGGPVLSP